MHDQFTENTWPMKKGQQIATGPYGACHSFNLDR